MSILALQDITKTYRVGDRDLRVLRGVSLTVESGEFVAVMGPSGSGKSTLMHIIGCLDVPTTGTYRLGDDVVSAVRPNQLVAIRRARIGFIFQSFNLLPRLSALQNVELPLVYSGAPNRHDRALEMLKRVGLEDRAGHFPRQLSGGEQQRVAIARALINNPTIILADEPTGNLDSQSGHEILQLFRQLKEQGRTILMVTHDHDLAEKAERIIAIRDGVILPTHARTS